MIWKKLQAIAIIDTVSIVFVISEPPGHSRVIVIFVGGLAKYLATHDISI